MEIDLTRLWDGSPAPAGIGGHARLAMDGGDLVLSWQVALAEPAHVPQSPPAFLDGLWEHDVVELFLAPAASSGSTRYIELEAGAGGHWLALALKDVRVREAELVSLPIRIEGRADRRAWRGSLAVPVGAIEGVIGQRPLKGLVTAVLGGREGERIHLAWPSLPGSRPDFHQPGSWINLEACESR